MKWSLFALFALVCAFFLADLLLNRVAEPTRRGDGAAVPFVHALHGDSIGLPCSACHTGAYAAARAYLPSKAECMDCHRLPLAEGAGIEALDSALAKAPEYPWSRKSSLPGHVVFHHGVHRTAGVACTDCHGTGYEKDVYGGEKFDMRTCLDCHRGGVPGNRNFRAAMHCAACHR